MTPLEIVFFSWLTAVSASLITLIALTASLRTSDKNRSDLCKERGATIDGIWPELKDINEKVTTVCTKVDILLVDGKAKGGK